MKRAAFGFRMHSGWGVLVAVSGDPSSVEVLDRRRIVITDPAIPGAKQPYHHAATLGISDPGFRESEKYLANCAVASERLAFTAIGKALRELAERSYRVEGSAVLLASGRPLPALAKVLASHPLLHTAEGQFFRNAVIQASQRLKLPVTEIREQELEERAHAAFGAAIVRLQRQIARMGSPLGPPWTKDHKAASLAAIMILTQSRNPLPPAHT